MLSRRDLLMSGAVVSQMRGDAGAAQRPSRSPADAPAEIDLTQVRDALADLRHLTASNEVQQVRDRQRLHFKVAQRFPNYIDIGLTVWERLTTWHLENHLPLKSVRLPDGRMEMEFMLSTLVLKSDVPDTWVSNPYD